MLYIGKYAVSALMIYIMFYKEAFGDRQMLLYGTFAVAMLCVLLDILVRKRIYFKGVPAMYLVYGMYSLCTGLIVASYQRWFLKSMVTYFAFALVCYCAYYISCRIGSSEWILNTIKCAAIICAVYTIVAGVDYLTEVYVRTMSALNNPHTLGLTMTLGIFSCMSDEKRTKNHFWLNLGLVGLFLVVILLCGSRKNLLASGILILIWIFEIIRSERGMTKKKISIYAGLLIMAIGGTYYVITRYMNSASFERMIMLFDSGGASKTRLNMYAEAYNLWKSHILFGVGFCQFQKYSVNGIYSHSSYAEILSCSGLVGALIFFVPIAGMAKKMIGKSYIQGEMRYDAVMCCALLLIELLLGTVMIYIYDLVHMMALTYLYMRENCLQRGY